MKIIKIECPNCAKSVNLDPDNLSSFCSYCGSKLMLDITQLQGILIEKEKTRQKEIEEIETTKRKQNQELTKQMEIQAQSRFDLGWFVFLVLIFIGMFVIALISPD